MNNNINNSVYVSILKNEMRKINANVNAEFCGNSKNRGAGNNIISQDLTADEEIGLVQAIEREKMDNGNNNIENIIRNIKSRNKNKIEESEDTENTEKIENIEESNNTMRYNRRDRYRYHRQRDKNSDELKRNDISIEFVDPTNVYRFIDQNFLNNLTGKSNIDVSNLHNNTFKRRLQIDEILKKYGRDK